MRFIASCMRLAISSATGIDKNIKLTVISLCIRSSVTGVRQTQVSYTERQIQSTLPSKTQLKMKISQLSLIEFYFAESP